MIVCGKRHWPTSVLTSPFRTIGGAGKGQKLWMLWRARSPVWWTPSVVFMMFVGILIGLVIGVLPGLGGIATLALMLPRCLRHGAHAGPGAHRRRL